MFHILLQIPPDESNLPSPIVRTSSLPNILDDQEEDKNASPMLGGPSRHGYSRSSVGPNHQGMRRGRFATSSRVSLGPPKPPRDPVRMTGTSVCPLHCVIFKGWKHCCLYALLENLPASGWCFSNFGQNPAYLTDEWFNQNHWSYIFSFFFIFFYFIFWCQEKKRHCKYLR